MSLNINASHIPCPTETHTRKLHASVLVTAGSAESDTRFNGHAVDIGERRDPERAAAGRITDSR